MLRNHRAHQEAAIASSLDREFFRARVFFFDQIFRGSREIIEHVLLFREIAGLVPVFAELAAASNIRHHINAAAIEPEPARKIEIRRHADAVAAVAVKQRRVLPVPFHSFPENDVERNLRAVLSRLRTRASLRCRQMRPATCCARPSSPARFFLARNGTRPPARCNSHRETEASYPPERPFPAQPIFLESG